MAFTVPPVVADVLKVAAPILLTALGGPLGGVAATIATSALSAWFPTPIPPAPGGPQPAGAGTATPGQVVQAIQQNADDPKFLLALREAEISLEKYQMDLGFRFADLEVKDRSNAREFSRDAGIATPMFKWGMILVIISMTLMLAVILGCIAAVAGVVKIDPNNAPIAIAAFTLIGTVVGNVNGFGMAVIQFFYGSSQSSRDKSDQMAGQLTSLGNALGEAAKAQVGPQAAPNVVVVPQAAAPAEQAPDKPAGPSRFIDLIEKLLDSEGGFVDNPADPGGCTSMGITLHTLREWRHNPDLTCDDVKALTRADAKEAYFARYWNALNCDSLPPGVDYIVFDFGVNAGVGRSAKTLQQVLAKRDPSLKVDGGIGPLTLAALEKASPRAVIDEFHQARMEFYRGLSTWPTFGKGWSARAEAVRADALAAATAAG